jgi:hypothetical protein
VAGRFTWSERIASVIGVANSHHISGFFKADIALPDREPDPDGRSQPKWTFAG